jgi:hypothetical protein
MSQFEAIWKYVFSPDTSEILYHGRKYFTKLAVKMSFSWVS